VLGEREDVLGIRNEARRRRERVGAAVTREVDREDAARPRELRSEERPREGDAPEAVHEHQRIAVPRAPDEAPDAGAPEPNRRLVESTKSCRTRPHERLSLREMVVLGKQAR